MTPNNKIITVLVVVALSFVVLVVDIPLIYEVYGKQDYIYTSVGVGWSMEPYIENGDTIVILTDDYPGFFANVGDVLVFQYNNMAVAHRIYNIQNGNYYVKGDNNENVDPWIIDSDSVIGKIIGVVGNGNIVTRYAINQII
jgi:signal peptidase I